MLHNFNSPNILTSKMNYGRWSREEHRNYLKYYQLYPNHWKKIATFIPTRTTIQVRTHHQKINKTDIKYALILMNLKNILTS